MKLKFQQIWIGKTPNKSHIKLQGVKRDNNNKKVFSSNDLEQLITVESCTIIFK
jgi:hypothetical protein